jgi:RNA polymerase sigma factor (sigma-70 family)
MLYTEQSDAELIGAYLGGAERALEILIHRYKDRVYTSIYMIVKDKYIAEDIFQDTFLKVVKTIREGRYAEQGKFLPWVVRVAHNLCMDYFRRTSAQMPITLSDGNDISHLFVCEETAGDRIERLQTHRSIRQLVEALPEDQREVVVLRMYAELSFKEISDLTGVSINTALGRMRYALINLRKMISSKRLVLR